MVPAISWSQCENVKNFKARFSIKNGNPWQKQALRRKDLSTFIVVYQSKYDKVC